MHQDNVGVAAEGNVSLAPSLNKGDIWWVLQGPKLKCHLFKLQLCPSSLKCNSLHKLHTVKLRKINHPQLQSMISRKKLQEIVNMRISLCDCGNPYRPPLNLPNAK